MSVVRTVVLAVSPGVRRGAACARAARSAALWTLFLSDLVRRDRGPRSFHGHWCGGVRRCFWGSRMGVWGKTWTGPLGVPGGSGFPPSAFPDWSPLLSVYSCSRAVVFLTSLCLLFEGVRSGTRRRRGASASAQAAGGTETETRRAVPARAGAALYGQCPRDGCGLCG